jgi:hypothetical protein
MALLMALQMALLKLKQLVQEQHHRYCYLGGLQQLLREE